MNKTTWKAIEAELKKCDVSSKVRDKRAFWQEFKARSSGIKQEVPISSPSPLLFRTSTWIKLAACIALAGLISFVTVTQQTKETIFVKNKIKKIEVFASYSAMIILDGDNDDGTIIWLTDLDTAGGTQSENL